MSNYRNVLSFVEVSFSLTKNHHLLLINQHLSGECLSKERFRRCSERRSCRSVAKRRSCRCIAKRLRCRCIDERRCRITLVALRRSRRRRDWWRKSKGGFKGFGQCQRIVVDGLKIILFGSGRGRGRRGLEVVIDGWG